MVPAWYQVGNPGLPGWKRHHQVGFFFGNLDSFENRSKAIPGWSYEKTEGTVKISVKNHADLWVQTIFFIDFLGFFDKNPILDHDMAILRAPSASSPNLGCYTTKNH